MSSTALSAIADQRIAEVLADPIVKMMMRADGVDRGTLTEELRAVARRLADDEEPAAEPPGWLAACLGPLKSTAAGACCR
ncbi:MAG TPA: hypothetical protein VL492_08925 [Methylovirgula sp.]|jgi:hypothetical protein|nr:hypothetical protein [Methylovirgula sp.]